MVAPANHRPEQTRDESRALTVSHQTQKVATGTEGTWMHPWYLGGAASSYMANCTDVYTFTRKIRNTVIAADGRELLSQGFGRIQVHFEENA